MEDIAGLIYAVFGETGEKFGISRCVDNTGRGIKEYVLQMLESVVKLLPFLGFGATESEVFLILFYLCFVGLELCIAASEILDI